MSHFAEINSDSIVQRVIVAEQDFINSGVVGDSFNWVQCSYNSNFRKQFPSVGYKYDKVNDIFIGLQPFPSWTLDSNHDWQPPIAQPDGAYAAAFSNKRMLQWDEANTKWVEV